MNRIEEQHGFVLITALVLLLILTLLGMATVRYTSLENRMAENTLDHQMAFEAAQTGMQQAENAMLQGLYADFLQNSSGLYYYNPLQQPWYAQINWSSSGAVIAYSGSIPNVAAQPVYMIEQMPTVAHSGQSVSTTEYGAGVPMVRVYQITVLGTGAELGTQVMTQTIVDN